MYMLDFTIWTVLTLEQKIEDQTEIEGAFD